MERLIGLINEIQDCTLEIEVHYPELYKLLDQTPYKSIFPKVSAVMLQDYLDTIKMQLETFKNTRCHESNATI